MKTVTAYRDNGWMSSLTRCKPRRVFCLEPAAPPASEVEHVVKYGHDAISTAALISEVVCTRLMAIGGIAVLDARLVEVSESYAASSRTKSEIPYPIVPGSHFGTILRHDVAAGPPMKIDQLADPQELVDLWMFDSWLCITDRDVYGNILLAAANDGRFHIIAADQSDGFGGAGRLADGSWKHRLAQDNPAGSLPFLDRAILDAGAASALHAALRKVESVVAEVPNVVRLVPDAWWRATGLDPAEIAAELTQRSRRMAAIVNLVKWEGLDDVTQGGILL